MHPQSELDEAKALEHDALQKKDQGPNITLRPSPLPATQAAAAFVVQHDPIEVEDGWGGKPLAVKTLTEKGVPCCSLCSAQRVVQDDGRAGACGNLECKDPTYDFNLEQLVGKNPNRTAKPVEGPDEELGTATRVTPLWRTDGVLYHFVMVEPGSLTTELMACGRKVRYGNSQFGSLSYEAGMVPCPACVKVVGDGLNVLRVELLPGKSLDQPATLEQQQVAALQAASKTDFAQSFSAWDWAKAFVEHVKANPSIATDEDTMQGWFANAIMRGYDESFRKQEAADAAAAPAGRLLRAPAKTGHGPKADKLLGAILDKVQVELDHINRTREAHAGFLSENEIKALLSLLDAADRCRRLRDELSRG